MQQGQDCTNRQVSWSITREEQEPTDLQCRYGKVFNDDLSELDDYVQSDQQGFRRWHTKNSALKSLHLHTNRELAAFLAESWFLKTYLEYAEGYLNPVTCQLHQWAPEKVEWTWTAAKTTLRMAKRIISKKSRIFFQDDTPDTSTWDSNQHRLRFMMRFLLCSQDHAIWTEEDTMPARCISAYKISCWLEWVHRPQYTSESGTNHHDPEQWSVFLRHSILLASIRGDLVIPPPEAGSPQPSTSDTSTPQSVDGDGESYGEGSIGSGDDQSVEPAEDGDILLHEPIPEIGNMPTKAAEQQFLSHQRHLLGQWGVAPEHRSTCVLVPTEWSGVDPAVMLQDVQANGLKSYVQYLDTQFRTDQTPGQRRLAWTIFKRGMAYARAGVWYNDRHWPNGKDESDWAKFWETGDSANKFHASHLCHHAHCICPSHIVWESQISNLSRSSCMSSAQTFRQYGYPTPEHCAFHFPPCLLQVCYSLCLLILLGDNF